MNHEGDGAELATSATVCIDATLGSIGHFRTPAPQLGILRTCFASEHRFLARGDLHRICDACVADDQVMRTAEARLKARVAEQGPRQNNGGAT